MHITVFVPLPCSSAFILSVQTKRLYQQIQPLAAGMGQRTAFERVLKISADICCHQPMLLPNIISLVSQCHALKEIPWKVVAEQTTQKG